MAKSEAHHFQDPHELATKALEVSRILKGLSHPTRLQILCRLCEGPCSVQELQEACALTQANTSQFLQRMRAEGCVEAERSGQNVIYRIKDPKLSQLLQAVASIYCPGRKRGNA